MECAEKEKTTNYYQPTISLSTMPLYKSVSLSKDKVFARCSTGFHMVRPRKLRSDVSDCGQSTRINSFLMKRPSKRQANNVWQLPRASYSVKKKDTKNIVVFFSQHSWDCCSRPRSIIVLLESLAVQMMSTAINPFREVEKKISTREFTSIWIRIHVDFWSKLTRLGTLNLHIIFCLAPSTQYNRGVRVCCFKTYLQKKSEHI